MQDKKENFSLIGIVHQDSHVSKVGINDKWKKIICTTFHFSHGNFQALFRICFLRASELFLATFTEKRNCQFVLMGMSYALLGMYGLLVKIPRPLIHVGPVETTAWTKIKFSGSLTYNINRPK